jgi:hypothetical protein
VVRAAAFTRDNESSWLPLCVYGGRGHVFLITKLCVRSQTAMNMQSAANTDVGIFIYATHATVGHEPIRPMDQLDGLFDCVLYFYTGPMQIATFYAAVEFMAYAIKYLGQNIKTCK